MTSMKQVFALTLVVCAASAFPDNRFNSLNSARTLTDDRIEGENGAYTVDFHTDNGIVLHEAGQSKDSEEVFVKAGSYSFDLDNGERFELKYVADGNGFQPESAYLPVAPVFPHPIEDFVLHQIEKAQREREEGLPVDDGSYRPWEY